MKSSRGAHFFSNSSSTVTYAFQNDRPTPQSQPKTTEIPIHTPESSSPIPVTVHFPTTTHDPSHAAVKIQSAYRSHVIRTLYRKISAVNSEADRLQRLIQRQETVDAVRSDHRERIKLNEALMGLLFRLDSVPGINPTVRELRRGVSRRIVGLQEILDSVSDTRVEDWAGFLNVWDDVIERMEADVCGERGGGYEIERFCAENLGFRCFQRFLRDQ